MKPIHCLTEPQVNLLLSLHERPRPVGGSYRPLQPLIEQELARPRAVRCPGSAYTYELTTKGHELAQEIVEARAEAENTKSAGG